VTDVRPPLPPDEGVTVLRPQFGAPRPDVEPEHGSDSVVQEYPPDPEVAIDTQEISLAELRAAAAAAGVELDEVVAHRPDVVDLAAEERAEVPAAPAPARPPAEPFAVDAGVAADQAGPEPDEEPGDDPGPESGAAGVATFAGPFGEPGAPIDPDAAPVVDGGDAATGAEAIDPRIAERRVAVTEAQLARRRRLLLLGVAVASAIGILWLIVQSPFLSVQHVEVRGATAQTRLAVERAAAVKDGSALLFLDTGAVARRVEALPWVAHASVHRDLPNGVTITVEERLPVAWMRRPPPAGSPPGALGPVAVVDVSGRVLEDRTDPPAGLPAIIGLDRVPRRGGHLASRAPAAALAAIPDALRAQTAALVLHHGQGVLQLGTPPGGARPAAGQVRLGRLDEVAQKGAAALAVLDQLARDGDTVRYVDVRVPGSPATR
jgi:cell division protein FtsQ